MSQLVHILKSQIILLHHVLYNGDGCCEPQRAAVNTEREALVRLCTAPVISTALYVRRINKSFPYISVDTLRGPVQATRWPLTWIILSLQQKHWELLMVSILVLLFTFAFLSGMYGRRRKACEERLTDKYRTVVITIVIGKLLLKGWCPDGQRWTVIDINHVHVLLLACRWKWRLPRLFTLTAVCFCYGFLAVALQFPPFQLCELLIDFFYASSTEIKYFLWRR